MLRFIVAGSLLASPALAQAPPIGQQVDSLVASISREVAALSIQIAQDQVEIERLKQQLAAARNAAKPAPPEPTKPAQTP
jgi:uncharacterized coiled-coil protein SlyX